MVRWEKEVYINGEKKYTRPEKKGLEELKNDLSYAEYKQKENERLNGNIIKKIEAEVQELQKNVKTKKDRKNLAYQKKYLQTRKNAFIQMQRHWQKEICNLKKQIRIFEENKNPSHKGFHYKTKRRSNEQIREMVLDYIKKENPDYISKEDIARLFEVKESQVEQVFRQLNLEGILNQPIHHAPHDSQRDPWGFQGNMGWMGDLYYIRNKEKEDKIFD